MLLKENRLDFPEVGPGREPMKKTPDHISSQNNTNKDQGFHSRKGNNH